MKAIFKQYIIDFHASEIPQPLAREIEMPILPKTVHKALVLIGMRRSGKTWIMYQAMQQLLSHGIAKEKIIYINFEDDRLATLAVDQFQLLLDAYFELYPQYINEQELYFFFDEIQEIEGWEKFIRRLLDTTAYKIYLSGSSAKMLSRELATGLRGRTITREVFPLSFAEYLQGKGVRAQSNFTTKDISVLLHYLDLYLEVGGFPETLEADTKLHIELIQGYIETVIFRDIVERYEISNITAVKRFIQYCLQNAAAPLSINKLYQTFQSQGIQTSKNNLYDFLQYFEDAYCIFAVPLFSFSQRKTTINPVKIYPVDPGIIRAYTVKNNFELAARFETVVFCHLRRFFQTVYYYKTAASKEVDFLTENLGDINLYQACYGLHSSETEEREVSALIEAMTELKLKESWLVTRDESKKITTESGVIHVIPLWRFLLSNIT